jgi:hypothetical protein
LVLETQLIQHLEKCLLIDTSSTVLELALMVLIMFLPHITASLTSDHHLAKMFLIYSRLLCWDKLGTPRGASDPEKHPEDSQDEGSEEDETDRAWETVHHSLEYPDSSPPTLLYYFTFLYGLFPLNFMSFVRKPRKFLKSQNFPGAEDFDLDQALIHSRTDPYRRVHLLHPNMFTTTIEDEFSENRWLKSDPADIVTECMDLCVAVSASLADPGPPPTSKLPDIPLPPLPNVPEVETTFEDDGTTATESAASWRNTQSTIFTPSLTDQSDTPELPLQPQTLKSSKSASPLLKPRDAQDSPIIPPMRAGKKQDLAGFSMMPPSHHETPAHRLGNLSQVLRTGSNSSIHSEFENQSMASLQREIMLLRNDLNFERYLKQQHLTHIGQLQRKHIKEATAEADTQNLINTNRTLKARLAKANEMYAQLKKETLTSRNQSKKWETELSTKVKSYREDQKVREGEEDTLRYDLKKTHEDCEHLKKMVERAEAEQLKAQQRTRALEFELEDYENVRRDLEDAQERISKSADQHKELDALLQERNELRTSLEVANMRLNSRELERERSTKTYERRIMELESRLQLTEKSTGRPGQLPASVQQMLDSALAANNAKLQQMKKTHYHLLKQYTELEMKYYDLEGERQAELGRRAQEKQNRRDTNEGFDRNINVQQGNAFASKYPAPLSPNTSTEDYDYYGEYHSPIRVNTPPETTSPLRPVRVDSIPVRHGSRDPSNIGLGQDFSAAYDASLNAQFQAQNTANTIHSSNKSAYSVDTNSSQDKDKAASKSEMRVYGRG